MRLGTRPVWLDMPNADTNCASLNAVVVGIGIGPFGRYGLSQRMPAFSVSRAVGFHE